MRAVLVPDIVDRGAHYLANKMLREMIEEQKLADSIVIDKDTAIMTCAVLGIVSAAALVWIKLR